MSKCKIYNKNEIDLLSESINLKIPKLTLRQSRVKALKTKTKLSFLPGRKKPKIYTFAKTLNENLPRSEKWFQSLWPFKDQFNEVFGCFIPDVLNRKYKYIIEIDGTIHQIKAVKKRDRKKDLYYRKFGYTVFRVIAYDINSYNNVYARVMQIRNL